MQKPCWVSEKVAQPLYDTGSRFIRLCVEGSCVLIMLWINASNTTLTTPWNYANDALSLGKIGSLTLLGLLDRFSKKPPDLALSLKPGSGRSKYIVMHFTQNI